jgi:hypothetical protein
MARLGEGHAWSHARSLRGTIGLPYLAPAAREAAKDHRPEAKLGAAAFFHGNPEAWNHTKIENHRVLVDAASHSLEHEF